MVKVKPSAKHARIERTDDAHFQVSVTEPARQGKANEAVIDSIAHFLGIATSRIQIISGKTSRNKIIEIS